MDRYNGETLLDDLDKAVDFLQMGKKEFVSFYSYLKDEDWEDMNEVFHDDIMGYLGTWWNCAEKLVTGVVDYTYSVTGEELKTAISNYADANLDGCLYEEYLEVCSGIY